MAGDDEVEAAAAAIRAAGAEALLVLSSMAVPPSWPTAVIAAVELPVVVWAARRGDGVRPGFSHADITREGATVGAPQITNVLGRRGTPFALVAGRIGDPAVCARVAGALRAAATAGALRRGTLLRVGEPIPGYLAVEMADEELARTIELRIARLAPAEVQAAYREAAAADVDAVVAELRAGFELAEDVERDGALGRSARLAVALAAVDARHGALAGAMNCHVPELRFADDPGITPCLALGRETTRGVPWTCAGDVVTAVAMVVAQRLGRGAIYHEPEALDDGSGVALIANTGEHDLAWVAPGTRPQLRRNGWFDGVDPRCGVCACFAPAAGPATLVAFTPHADEPSGVRLIAAEGLLTGAEHPETGTVNGAFVFGDGSGPVGEAWERWARAGANHHSAATLGHVGALVAQVAMQLGIGVVRVS